jgi:hypothetical protein
LNVDRLDVFEGDLVTSVERVAGDESTALYEFSVSTDDVVLLSGRAAIAFNVFAGLAPSGDGAAAGRATLGAAAEPISASVDGAAAASGAAPDGGNAAAGVATVGNGEAP